MEDGKSEQIAMAVKLDFEAWQRTCDQNRSVLPLEELTAYVWGFARLCKENGFVQSIVEERMSDIFANEKVSRNSIIQLVVEGYAAE